MLPVLGFQYKPLFFWPINPISIIWALAAFDLDMSLDGCFEMPVKRQTNRRGKEPSAPFRMPIFTGKPKMGEGQ